VTGEFPAGEPFGPYTLVALLGEGGMARVYRAVREGPMGFRKELAIKRIRRDLTRDDETLVRHLINEARLGGQLRHPNLVDVYEFGQVGDDHYLAMEYVRGATLEMLLAGVKQRGLRLPRSAVLDLGRQVCEGLSYAHAMDGDDGEPLHLVHRDLKPANIIVSSAGQAKIMDFGIARNAAALYKTTTATAAKGTLQYMSPEQLESPDALDHRADLFAVGSILFEALVGEPLMASATAQALMWMIVAGTFRPRLGKLDEVFPAARPVIARCVEVDPAERYEDAAALARDLERLAEDEARGPGCRELMGLVAALAEGNGQRLESLSNDILASDRRSGGDTGWSDFVGSLQGEDGDDLLARSFEATVDTDLFSSPGAPGKTAASTKVTVAWRADDAGADELTVLDEKPVERARSRPPVGVAAGALVLFAVLLALWWRPWATERVEPVEPREPATPAAAADESFAALPAVVEDPTPDPIVEPPTPASEERTPAPERIPEPTPTATADAPRVAVHINSDPWSRITLGGDRSAPTQDSPFAGDLPPGTYQFQMRVPDTGDSKTLTLTLDGEEGTVSRCWSFPKDGPC